MNKKKCSVLVIITTIITVIVILAYNNIEYDLSIKSIKTEVRANPINSQKVNTVKNKDLNKDNTDIKNGVDRTKNKISDSEQNKTVSTVQNQISSNVQKQTNNEENNKSKLNDSSNTSNSSYNGIVSENTNDDLKNEETSSVFKIQSDKIQGELTLADKEKILAIANKLSPVDYVKIKNYLESSDAGKGMMDTMKLLKERLTESDYQRIRGVASKFLNMNVIDNQK